MNGESDRPTLKVVRYKKTSYTLKFPVQNKDTFCDRKWYEKQGKHIRSDIYSKKDIGSEKILWLEKHYKFFK